MTMISFDYVITALELPYLTYIPRPQEYTLVRGKDRLTVFSKIQLVVYYQCCVLLG